MGLFASATNAAAPRKLPTEQMKEIAAKQMIEQEKKEKWAKIHAQKGQSFLRGSGI